MVDVVLWVMIRKDNPTYTQTHALIALWKSRCNRKGEESFRPFIEQGKAYALGSMSETD